MRYETWKLQNTLEEYMYPDVVQDFDSKDGYDLIKDYGGAVLLGLDLGGQWSDNLAVSKLYENSTSDVTVSMEAAYGSFVSGHGGSEISEVVENKESIASRRVIVIGGDPQYAPGQIDEWQASVKSSPAFMNFTPDGLMWIWDLFPRHAEKLKSGFKRYADEHKLDVPTKGLLSFETIEGHQYATDKGSGAYEALELYKPQQTTDTYKYVGVNGNDNKVLIIKELSANYGAVRAPTEWQQVWNDRGSKKYYAYNCWLPLCPPEYVALGVYCRFRVDDQDPPSRDEAKGMVIVHKSYVKETGFSTEHVWKDAGSKAWYDLTLGRLPHNALWPSYTTDPKCGQLPTKYTVTMKNE